MIFAGPKKGGVVLDTRVNVSKLYRVKGEDDWFRHWDIAKEQGFDFMKPKDIQTYFQKLGYEALDVTAYERRGGMIVLIRKELL